MWAGALKNHKLGKIKAAVDDIILCKHLNAGFDEQTQHSQGGCDDCQAGWSVSYQSVNQGIFTRSADTEQAVGEGGREGPWAWYWPN